MIGGKMLELTKLLSRLSDLRSQRAYLNEEHWLNWIEISDVDEMIRQTVAQVNHLLGGWF